MFRVRRPADKTRLPEARWTPGSHQRDKANTPSALQAKPRHSNLTGGQRGSSKGEETERAEEEEAAAGWLAETLWAPHGRRARFVR